MSAQGKKNDVWDGTRWVSGEKATPAEVAAAEEPRGTFDGANYIPNPKLLARLREQRAHAPATPPPLEPSRFEPSPSAGSVITPNIPLPGITPQAFAPNVRADALEGRPLTAEEQRLVAASRAAPGGIVDVVGPLAASPMPPPVELEVTRRLAIPPLGGYAPVMPLTGPPPVPPASATMTVPAEPIVDPKLAAIEAQIAAARAAAGGEDPVAAQVAKARAAAGGKM